MVNKQSWNYISQQNKVTVVSLHHKVATGELLIYFAEELLWAEKNVSTQISIPFFCDDELCKIHVIPKNNKYYYEFEIDRKADTPYNRLRKAADRKEFTKGMSLVVLTVGILVGLVGGGFLYNKYVDACALRDNGINVAAKLTPFPHSKYNCTASADNIINFAIQLDTLNGAVLLPCGLPVALHDEFVLRYDPDEVTNNFLNLNAPTEWQMQRLFNRTLEHHYIKHPNAKASTEAQCILQAAMQLNGLRGMADFYYQDTEILEYAPHNRLTYALMCSRFDYRDAVDECR